jgi:LAGLIDADG endonuclease
LYPFIKVCFNIADLPLAEYLKNLFGGRISVNVRKTYVVWVINKQLDVYKLACLLNGKFRTPKVTALHNLIDFLNENRAKNQDIILKSDIDNSCLSSNAWLSGFSDADGNFNISITERKKTKTTRIQLSFRLASHGVRLCLYLVSHLVRP